LSVRRLREWADVHGQLAEITRELRWSTGQAATPKTPTTRGSGRPAPPPGDAIHRALLTGLLGNIGLRALEGGHYEGAHQQKFWIHPGSAVGRRAARMKAGPDGTGQAAEPQGRASRWVMAAEMVDTGRLYA